MTVSSGALSYLVVGDGRGRDDMTAAVRRFGIEKNVFFAGWQPYEQVPDYLRLADIAVYPSESEGLCRAYLEAMASERVLIASDIPAAVEIIENGVSGLLFSKGNIADLAQTTLIAAADPKMRRRIGRAARQAVANGYEISIWARGFETALFSVIE